MEEIIIYTDGACKYNPGPGGYAAIIFDKDEKKGIKNRSMITTNNIMELTAVVEALKWTVFNSKIYLNNYDANIKVYSDSTYVVNSVNNKWLDNWAKNDFKKAGKDIKNIELWIELYNILGDINNIEFIKVKGHAGDKYNELCDKYAVMEAAKALEELKSFAKSKGVDLSKVEITDFIADTLKFKNEEDIENRFNSNNNLIFNNENNKKNLNTTLNNNLDDNLDPNFSKEKLEEEELKELKEKEIVQSDTIVSLVKENSMLKNKVRKLEEKIKELEGK